MPDPHDFKAQYTGGRCAIGDDEIEEGDWVRYVDGQLVHTACHKRQLADDNDEPQEEE